MIAVWLAIAFAVVAIAVFEVKSKTAKPVTTCPTPCDSTPCNGTGNGTGSLVADVAREAGFTGDDLVTAVAIAYAESGGDPNIVGDKKLAPTKGPSIGLWQINIGSKAHPEWANENLRDPQVNAGKAFILYQRRQAIGQTGFEDWSAYTPDATYTFYLDRAAQETGIAV